MDIKVPNQIIRQLQKAAPDYDISEDFGRRLGFYGDANETAAGYKAICIYVQNGLADYSDLFCEIAKAIFKIQSENQRYYPLLVFGFGKTTHLQHEKKYFRFGFLSESQNYKRVAAVLSRISGPDICSPAIIPELFPKTDNRRLYDLKTKIEKDDLLIIIGRENEVFLNETLIAKNTKSFRKQILFVEIGNEAVSYIAKNLNLEFKSFNNL